MRRSAGMPMTGLVLIKCFDCFHDEARTVGLRCLLSFTESGLRAARRRPLDHTSKTRGAAQCGAVLGLRRHEIDRSGRLPRRAPQAYAAALAGFQLSRILNRRYMNDAADNELGRFLAAHPSVRFFDAFVNDLNTIERGKRIDRAGIPAVFDRGMPLPGSM